MSLKCILQFLNIWQWDKLVKKIFIFGMVFDIRHYGMKTLLPCIIILIIYKLI